MKIIGTKALIGVAVLSALWAATPAGAIPITDTVNPTDTTITFGSTPTCPTGFAYLTSNGTSLRPERPWERRCFSTVLRTIIADQTRKASSRSPLKRCG